MDTDFEEFKTKVLVHLEKLTNAVESLAKATNKVSEAVFGNGDIKTGLMWRVEKMDVVIAEYAQSKKNFDLEIEAIKKDLQEGQDEFNTLQHNDSLQKTGMENLSRLNAALGWMGQGWKHAVFGWGLVAAAVYGVAWVAVSIPPAVLAGLLIKLITSMFGA